MIHVHSTACGYAWGRESQRRLLKIECKIDLKPRGRKGKWEGGLTQSTFSGAVTTLELTERETLIKPSELNYTYLVFSMHDCLFFGLSTMFGIKAKDEIKLSGFRDST